MEQEGYAHELRERLIALADASGLSQGSIAERTGIDQTTLSRILKRVRPAGISHALGFSMAFAVSLDYLYYGKDDGDSPGEVVPPPPPDVDLPSPEQRMLLDAIDAMGMTPGDALSALVRQLISRTGPPEPTRKGAR